jgi:hypothetical protein
MFYLSILTLMEELETSSTNDTEVHFTAALCRKLIILFIHHTHAFFCSILYIYFKTLTIFKSSEELFMELAI